MNQSYFQSVFQEYARREWQPDEPQGYDGPYFDLWKRECEYAGFIGCLSSACYRNIDNGIEIMFGAWLEDGRVAQLSATISELAIEGLITNVLDRTVRKQIRLAIKKAKRAILQKTGPIGLTSDKLPGWSRKRC
jgi:hypothetical protein